MNNSLQRELFYAYLKYNKLKDKYHREGLPPRELEEYFYMSELVRDLERELVYSEKEEV